MRSKMLRRGYGALGLPTTSVVGHQGELIVGQLGGKKVAMLAGRIHAYEGRSMEECCAVRAMAAWGARFSLMTSAVGSLHTELRPGDLVQITDHINHGINPLLVRTSTRWDHAFRIRRAPTTLSLRSKHTRPHRRWGWLHSGVTPPFGAELRDAGRGAHAGTDGRRCSGNERCSRDHRRRPRGHARAHHRHRVERGDGVLSQLNHEDVTATWASGESPVSAPRALGEHVVTDDDRKLLRLRSRRRSRRTDRSHGTPSELRPTDGELFTGCNVESASFSLTCCAERVAVFKAVSEGSQIRGLRHRHCRRQASAAVWCLSAGTSEFGQNMRIVLGNPEGEVRILELFDLLPEGFTAEQLWSEQSGRTRRLNLGARLVNEGSLGVSTALHLSHAAPHPGK